MSTLGIAQGLLLLGIQESNSGGFQGTIYVWWDSGVHMWLVGLGGPYLVGGAQGTICGWWGLGDHL